MGRSSLRTYESGAAKRKKKAEIEKNIEKHRKLDSFLLKTESHANSSTSANFTNSGISEEANFIRCFRGLNRGGSNFKRTIRTR